MTDDWPFRDKYFRPQLSDNRRLAKCKRCGTQHVTCEEVLSGEFEDKCGECGAVASFRELSNDEYADAMLGPGPHEGEKPLSERCLALDIPGPAFPEGQQELQADLLECIEAFGEGNLAQWLKRKRNEDPMLMERRLDDFYTRTQSAKVKGMVGRTLKLNEEPDIEPPPHVRPYLREATRCYIYGFWDSSVALSRAALEMALSPPEDTASRRPCLKKLIEVAYNDGRLDEPTLDMAENIRESGNRVLHGEKSTNGNAASAREVCERRAWDALYHLRGVLGHLYRRP